MRDRGDVKLDAGSAAEPGEFSLDEVRPIVRDDVVGVAVAVNNALEELDGRWPVQLFDGFMNFSTASNRCVLPPLDLLSGSTMSNPQTANDQVIGIVLSADADVCFCVANR